jgi:hypothetical protein
LYVWQVNRAAQVKDVFYLLQGEWKSSILPGMGLPQTWTHTTFGTLLDRRCDVHIHFPGAYPDVRTCALPAITQMSGFAEAPGLTRRVVQDVATVGLAVMVGILCVFFGKRVPTDAAFMGELGLMGNVCGYDDSMAPIAKLVRARGVRRLFLEEVAAQRYLSGQDGPVDAELQVVGMTEALAIIPQLIRDLPSVE